MATRSSLALGGAVLTALLLSACGGGGGGRPGMNSMFTPSKTFHIFATKVSVDLEPNDNGIPIIVAAQAADCELVREVHKDMSIGDSTTAGKFNQFDRKHRVSCPEGTAIVMTASTTGEAGMACEEECSTLAQENGCVAWPGDWKTCRDRFAKLLDHLESH